MELDERDAAVLLAAWELVPRRVIIADRAGYIRMIGPELARTLGFEESELRGRPVADIVRGGGRFKPGEPPTWWRGQLLNMAHRDGGQILIQVRDVFALPCGGETVDFVRTQRVREWVRPRVARPDELRAIAAVSCAMCEATNVDDVLQSALDKLGELLEMEMGVVALLEEGGGVRIPAHRGVAREELESRVGFGEGDGVIGIPVITGEPLLIPDLEKTDLETHARTLGWRSVVAAPVIVRGDIVGAIVLGSPMPREEYGYSAYDLMRAMSLQVGMAMDNARLLQREAARARQLEAAVQEVHHRVKNNLETLSAILECARGKEGVGELVDRLLERVDAMAAVHSLMREGTLGDEVDGADLVKQVVTLIGDSCGRREQQVRLTVSADPCTLPAATATSVALVTSELVSNALRHAFDGVGGEVKVRMECRGDQLCLSVADDGKGMPAELPPPSSGSAGLQIVRALVEHSLRGSFDIRSERGTRATVTFRIPGRMSDAREHQSAPANRHRRSA